MDKVAKKRRKATGENIWGPNELEPFRDRFNIREVLITWIRPFKMFLTEPIVLTLSLLSGFSDALIFMFIQSFALVYKQWDFQIYQVGLAFLPLGIGYLLAWLAFIPAIRRNIKERQAKPGDEKAQYESRLWLLLYAAPCLPIGLFGFAWTIQGPPLPWIASMIFAGLVGIANYSIYMATIDYMICAYGPYSASATGGNGWSRDFLAGVLTIPATPFFGSKFLYCITSGQGLTADRYWRSISSQLCRDYPSMYLLRPCHCSLRHLLVRTNASEAFSICTTSCKCDVGHRQS